MTMSRENKVCETLFAELLKEAGLEVICPGRGDGHGQVSEWGGGGEIPVRRTSGREHCKDPLWKRLFPTSQSDGLIPPREGVVNSFSFFSEHAQPKR